MRLLLIEDDPLLGKGLNIALSGEGYTVDWLRDGALGVTALETGKFDVVVLDLGLPGMDGLELLKRMRDQGNATPVLILTARDAIPDRISGLDSGADDYLTKPFDIDELFARVRALIRRASGRSQPQIKHRDLVLDPAAHTLTQGGEPVTLSNREFAVLHYLLEHKNRPSSRSQLEESLYGWGQEIESNAIEVHIHKLRKKLGSDLIKTIRGIGYVLE